VVELGVVVMIWYISPPPYDMLTKVEWSYIYTHPCIFVLMVGVVAAFHNARIFVDHGNKGNFNRFT
jgi:hypothetical protein